MIKNRVELDLQIKAQALEEIKTFMDDEIEVEIGDLKAGFIYDFITETLGKEFYNKGVEDSRKFLMNKMEDLEVEMDSLRRS